MLEFIEKFKKKKTPINMHKIDNILESTSFSNMQKLENKNGFSEAVLDKKTGKRKPFFNLGPNNKWQKLLDDKIRIKLENAFYDELKELKYL